MRIVIFGASGKTGQELVRQALEQGHHVTAFVRTPARLNVSHPNLQILQGDVANAESVRNAIKGQDAVLSALGAASPFKYDPIVVEGVRHLVQAMEQENVKRFIYMSFAGVAEKRDGVGFVIKYVAPKLLRTEIAGHTAREHIIRQSSLDWTIVHPTTLTTGPHTQEYKSGENVASKGFVVKIARADVADFMLKQLTDRQYVRKTPRVMY
ncbi:MAG TPA: SDR family oxidoreductase [Saprospiraceae bacterium]|nr:SDR family oxidoreductase [Saprospiraceae bacterium]